MTSDIHNFIHKLADPAVFADVTLAMGVGGGRQRRGSLRDAFASRLSKVRGPISVNLDLTVACNYRCAHCVDAEMLNSGSKYKLSELYQSLIVLRLAGLRSVILIGGGEPTLHPDFCEVVWVIKQLGLQVGVVSNGGNTRALERIAPSLMPGDWVRLSLDAGANDTFIDMHQPRKRGTSLEAICNAPSRIKSLNASVSVGFSFIVASAGATVGGRSIRSNVREILSATILAKMGGFDYISFKPLLDRDPSGAETVSDSCRGDQLRMMRKQLSAARFFQSTTFRVVPSVNLIAMLEPHGSTDFQLQPRRCHMHLFRQVLTPVGTYGCPVYRANPKDWLGPAQAYASVDDFLRTRRRTFELREEFNATTECRNVTCLYNSANWWLERLFTGRGVPEHEAGASDWFL